MLSLGPTLVGLPPTDTVEEFKTNDPEHDSRKHGHPDRGVWRTLDNYLSKDISYSWLFTTTIMTSNRNLVSYLLRLLNLFPVFLYFFISLMCKW